MKLLSLLSRILKINKKGQYTMELIDEKTLSKLLPLNKEIKEWCALLNEMLPAYGITTPERIAAFIAQCSHESVQFRILEENLYYSEGALKKLFGKYFEKRDASSYAKQPEKIANVIYANRMGNGGIKSGDGYKFRGRGIIQLTGKNNYTKFAEYIGKDIDEVIGYLKTKRGALHSALWYWDKRKLNKLADKCDIKQITRKINGGYIGLTERIENYEHAMTLLGGDIINCGYDDPHFKPLLQQGSKGKDVAELQELLGVAVDGYFGEDTLDAVIIFQIENDLVPDGMVGPITHRALEEYKNS